MAVQESVLALQERLANEQRLVHVIDRVHAAKSLDSIFIEVQGEILTFFDADRMTLYAMDQERKELYSKFLALDTVKEIRLPISSKSVAGFVAVSRQTVNIADAYDSSELKRVSPDLHFDASWDKRTGFRTTQILAMPILHEGKVFGVVQLLNKRHGSRFTKDDEASVARIAKTLGIAFNNQAQLGAQRRGTKFDYLISQGLVSQDEINQAIGQARQKNLDVETVLVEQFRVPKAEMGTSLSQFYRTPFVEFDAKIIPPPDLMKDLKLEFLKRNLWLPIRREDNAIVVLIDNPQDLQRVDAIHQLLRGQNIVLAVGLRKDINMYLALAGGELSSKDNIGNILSDLGAETQLEKEDVSGRRHRRERQRGHPSGQPGHHRRVQGAGLGHPRRALRHAEGHDDPAAHRRPVPRVPADPRRLSARPGRAAQDHGPARHRRAAQAAGRQDQVPPARRPRSRAPRGDTADAGRQRGRGHAAPRRQRADPDGQAGLRSTATCARCGRRPRSPTGSSWWWGRPARARRPRCTRCSATSTGPSGRSGLPRIPSRSRSTGSGKCRCSRRSASRSRRPCARSSAPTPT